MRWESWQRDWLFPHRVRVPVCWCLFGHVWDNKDAAMFKLFPASYHSRHLPLPLGIGILQGTLRNSSGFPHLFLYSLLRIAISGFSLAGRTFKWSNLRGVS